jgi:hypothetical protein
MTSMKAPTAIHPDKTPVAQEVKTYCTREKVDTFHIVMNHDKMGLVDRVKCKACGSEHKYRKQEVKKTSSSTPKTAFIRSASGTLMANPSAKEKKSETKSALLEDAWFSKLKKWGEKEIRVFDPATHFTVGEVLNHTVFGKGVVEGRRENRIDVLFQTGLKTLPSA